MKLKFSKYQGCGNDFIIIDNLDNSIKLTQKQIKRLCDRHFGIGADGLILVEKKNDSYFMNYYNSDGSKAEMCGNGMRCTALYLRETIEDRESFQITSLSGTHEIKIDELISVTLPKENFDPKLIGLKDDNLSRNIILNNKPYKIDFVSMGNPHGVLIVDNLNELNADTISKVASAPFLTNGANINLVQIIDNDNIKIKTYERGDGFTLACGTGSCASAVITNKNNLASKSVNVYNPGGLLKIDLLDNQLILSGKAERVYQGEVEI